MPYSWVARSIWHALLYTKQNQLVCGFSMPKGFGIDQHIRQIPGTSKLNLTFGHTVEVGMIYPFLHHHRDTLIELLGFKYKYYMSQPAVSVDGGGGGGDTGASAVPDDLFKQTSLMIQHGILEMDAIYAMLGPDDKQIEEEAAKEVSFQFQPIML